MATTILMVDDHPSFRRVLGSVLSGVPDLQIVGEASNGMEAIEKARSLKPDVVIMDLRMPELNGVKATDALREAAPDSKVLILTLFDEADDLFSAMKAGARGYLLKSAELDGLITSIKEIAAGNVIITPVMAARLANEFKTASKRHSAKDTNSLAPREKQVIQLMAQGLSLSEVAREISASDDDIKHDLRQVVEKFQAKYRVKPE